MTDRTMVIRKGFVILSEEENGPLIYQTERAAIGSLLAAISVAISFGKAGAQFETLTTVRRLSRCWIQEVDWDSKGHFNNPAGMLPGIPIYGTDGLNPALRKANNYSITIETD